MGWLLLPSELCGGDRRFYSPWLSDVLDAMFVLFRGSDEIASKCVVRVLLLTRKYLVLSRSSRSSNELHFMSLLSICYVLISKTIHQDSRAGQKSVRCTRHERFLTSRLSFTRRHHRSTLVAIDKSRTWSCAWNTTPHGTNARFTL